MSRWTQDNSLMSVEPELYLSSVAAMAALFSWIRCSAKYLSLGKFTETRM